MAQDSFGNYEPGLASAGAILSFPGTGGTGTQQVFFSGNSSPNNATLSPGPAVAYDSKGGFYVKVSQAEDMTWETRIAPSP